MKSVLNPFLFTNWGKLKHFPIGGHSERYLGCWSPLGLHNIYHYAVDLQLKRKESRELGFHSAYSPQNWPMWMECFWFWLSAYEALRALKSIVVISYQFSPRLHTR
jgi:hypothetical protein